MPKTNHTELSLLIDNAVSAKHLKNKDFAKKIGCDEANVSRCRRGLLLPPRDKLPVIAKVLGIDPNELTRLWRVQKYPKCIIAQEETASEPGKRKARLLLHFYDGETFLGQTFPEIEVDSFACLEAAVIEAYPGTKRNLYGIPTKTSGASMLLRLPSLREGYGPNTVVKVMQVILLP